MPGSGWGCWERVLGAGDATRPAQELQSAIQASRRIVTGLAAAADAVLREGAQDAASPPPARA